MRFLLAISLIFFSFSKSKISSFESDSQVKIIAKTSDVFGKQKQTYMHYYKDYPVAFSEFHQVSKNGKSKTYGRKFDIDISFNKNEIIPLPTVLRQLDKNYVPMIDSLVVLDVSLKNVEYTLAYQLYNTKNNNQYYVNAFTGNVELVLPTKYGCSSTLCSGASEHYGTLTFNGCYNQNEYILKNEAENINLWNADSITDLSLQLPFNPVKSNTNFFDDTAAVTTYYTIEQTHNYFSNTFQYNGLDGDRFPITAWLTGNDNFFYDKIRKAALIGIDGNITIDLVTHEIVHGITDLTAGLIYLGESGALNESFSDIFGEAVEYYALGNNDWLVNSDVNNNQNPIRDFANPENYFQPDTFLHDQYWFDGFEDCGGVHINSGVQNHWFYLLSEGGKGVQPIGINKAATITFRNLNTYLFPMAHYKDAKTGSLQAAEDIFGVNSFEVNQVQNAWQAVGVFNNAELDSLTLVDLYQLTNGDNWSISWDLTQSMNFWHGVVLDNDRRVISLDLSNNNLTNYLSFKIGNLSELAYLDVSDNPTTRTLIFELGNLKKLMYLDLSNSNMSLGYYNYCSDDYYLSVLSELTNLIYLDISNNGFTGCYPYQMRLLAKQIPSLGNIKISNGNNLDATWADFVNNNKGYCGNCIDDFELNTSNEFKFLPQVYNSIKTNGNILLNNVDSLTEIFAGNKVTLNTGFEVSKNTNLLIDIKSCTNN